MATTQKRFTSPRCNEEDAIPDKTLRGHESRWMKMSQLAGPHRQEDQVLRLPCRPIEPKAFRSGVPPQVAARVKVLHICVAQDNLPEWLDVLSNSCFALEHLHLNQDTTQEEEEMFEGSSCSYESSPTKATTAARMRRLYILYRLPDLLSIDGVEVTEEERLLARPDTPNGQRVIRDEWIDDVVDGDSDFDVLPQQQHGDVVEVSLSGLVKRIHADPPQESWEEPEWEKPYQPTITEYSAIQIYEKLALRSEQRSPALLLSEVSDDESSPARLNTMATTDTGAGCLPRLQQIPNNMHGLCSRSEKYLPMDDEHDSFEIKNPHILSGKSIRRNKKHEVTRTEDSSEREITRAPLELKASSRMESTISLGRSVKSLSTGANVVPLTLCAQRSSITTGDALLRPLKASPSSRQDDMKHSQERESSFPQRIVHDSTTRQSTVAGTTTVDALASYLQSPTPSSPGMEDWMSPHSASLTSPFPMQFRSRTAPVKLSVPEENRGTIDAVHPPSASTPFILSPRYSSSNNYNNNNSNHKKVCLKDDRPPPFPGRVVVPPSPVRNTHEIRRKRVLGRWRNRSQIRNTPMMDKDFDDDDDDEDDEDNNAEGDSQPQQS